MVSMTLGTVQHSTQPALPNINKNKNLFRHLIFSCIKAPFFFTDKAYDLKEISLPISLQNSQTTIFMLLLFLSNVAPFWFNCFLATLTLSRNTSFRNHFIWVTILYQHK